VNKKHLLIGLGVLFSAFGPVFAGTPKPKDHPTSGNYSSPAESMQQIEKNPDFVDISKFPHVLVDLRYAGINNFMGADLYGPIYGSTNKVFLHKDAAVKLARAVKFLEKEKPGWSFLVFDALRPRSVQWMMWDKVKNTPQKKYVANPAIGSPHNYGMALDIGLTDGKNGELDMGTGFDYFGPLAEPRNEKKYLKMGKLTKKQEANRLILRRVMTKAGFIQLSHEWWHYNALPEPEIRKKYKIVE
jgi:zinc D-Ala-D-Ala dipeptidase